MLYQRRTRVDVMLSINQLRLRVVVFMISATYQPLLLGGNNFGTNPMDFGMKYAAGIIRSVNADRG